MASARRSESGELALVSDAQVGFVSLDPRAPWPDGEGSFALSFRGAPLEGNTPLTELGVRQDEELALEFRSPAMPDALRLLRAVAPEKTPKDKPKGNPANMG